MNSPENSSSRPDDSGEGRPHSFEPRPKPLKFILVFLVIVLIAALSAVLGFLTMDYRFTPPDEDVEPQTPGDSGCVPDSLQQFLMAHRDHRATRLRV
jgi:hypothetical protein